MPLSERQQESLLMYLETCLVDKTGNVDSRRMNEEEMEIAKRWAKQGLIEFGRLPAHKVFARKRSTWKTHYVRFSDKAWIDASRFRRERAERNSEATFSASKCGSQ